MKIVRYLNHAGIYILNVVVLATILCYGACNRSSLGQADESSNQKRERISINKGWHFFR